MLVSGQMTGEYRRRVLYSKRIENLSYKLTSVSRSRYSLSDVVRLLIAFFRDVFVSARIYVSV